MQIQAPRSFLAKVAQSVLSNHYRRQKLERAYLEALQHVPAHGVPDLETQAILMQTLMQLDAVLERLERPVRQAFLGGSSTAWAMSRSPNACKSR